MYMKYTWMSRYVLAMAEGFGVVYMWFKSPTYYAIRYLCQMSLCLARRGCYHHNVR